MKQRPHILRTIFAGDVALWVIFLLLSVISLIAVGSSLGYTASRVAHGTATSMFLKHLGFVLGTYVVVIIVAHIRHRYFGQLSRWAFYLSLVLLAIVMMMGTDRWLALPSANGNGHRLFQPSELAKVSLMLYMAYTIAINRNRLDQKECFYRLLVPLLLTCLLVGPKNLSTGLLILIVGYLLIFFGGVTPKQWWKGLGLFAGLTIVGFLFIYYLGSNINIWRFPTWSSRLHAWFHPDYTLLTQDNMARMAVARGGFFRPGIGTTIHGRLMTQADSDFIFSVIIEEAGSFVGLCIFILYAWFYFRCIRIASACKGTFGSLAVAGIGTLVFVQAVTNMAVAVGLLPVTGQTLPFISNGGSSYLCLGCGLGVIQAVAVDNKRKAHEAALAEEQAQENEIENNETPPSEEIPTGTT